MDYGWGDGCWWWSSSSGLDSSGAAREARYWNSGIVVVE